MAFARRSSGARTPEKGKNHGLCLHGEKAGIALKEFLVDTNRDIVSELQTLPPAAARHPGLDVEQASRTRRAAG